MSNPMLLTDGYKLGHRPMFPRDTTRMQSNITARGSRIPDQTWVVFEGLQGYLQRYMMDDMQIYFFNRPVDVVCAEYQARLDAYFGPNLIGTDHIRQLHELGYIPLEFKAVPEGTHVPCRVPMVLVENTHPDFYWLPNYFETLMSAVLWPSITSATTAWRMRDLLERAAVATGSPLEGVGFQGHDFSMRGMMGPEAAQLSGIGHLLFFEGTDTFPAIEYLQRYYSTGWDSPLGQMRHLAKDYLIGCSVPASEHSVQCAGGKDEELETFERLIFEVCPTGIVSVVSDTWNLWEVLTDILPKLHDRIMERDGKVVIRPDSGDPVLIICGDPAAPVGSPEHKGVVQLLWETFGGTVTSTGHKLLDSHIGAIYGDSITYERADAILTNLYRKGFASGNVVFGIGSYTYQYVTRDTFQMAMKATWVERGGVGMDIFKDPVTDSGMKKSAKGRLAAIPNEDGTLSLVNQATPEQEAMSLLQPVWRDGQFLKRYTFEDVRRVARA